MGEICTRIPPEATNRSLRVDSRTLPDKCAWSSTFGNEIHKALSCSFERIDRSGFLKSEITIPETLLRSFGAEENLGDAAPGDIFGNCDGLLVGEVICVGDASSETQEVLFACHLFDILKFIIAGFPE
jgi:hypothetical protein